MNQRRVPAVYLDPRNLPFLAFLARIGISKLRGINGPQGFESHPASKPFKRPIPVAMEWSSLICKVTRSV